MTEQVSSRVGLAGVRQQRFRGLGVSSVSISARRMSGWKAGVGVPFEELHLVPGWCYLQLVKECYRERVARQVGPWPAIGHLLSMDHTEFRDVGYLNSVKVELSDVLHVVVDGVISLDQSGVRFVDFMDLVSILGRDDPVFGSLAHVHWSQREEVDLTGIDLFTEVGGKELPVRPLGNDPMQVVAYNMAIAGYYWSGCFGEAGELFSERVFSAVGKTLCSTVDDVERSSGGLAETACPRGCEEGVVPEGVRRGPNWERNVLNRKLRKEKKKNRQIEGITRSVYKQRSGRRGFFSECSEEVQQGLRQTRAELLVEQNKLALLKAKRGLKVLEDSDVNEEVRRYRTSIRASTEKNMVSIEKTHATLKATGNVPGFAETVVSDGGIPTPELIADGTGDCSITPDSSASQAEFRACQKALLDAEKRNVELEEALKKFGVTLSMSKNMDKETFTDDTVGNDLFAEFYPNGEVVHYVDRSGKKKFKVGEEYVVHDFKKMKEAMGDEAWKEFLRT